MKKIIFIPLILCAFVLAACGAAKIPMDANNKNLMNMKPVSGEETLSEWSTPSSITTNKPVTISILIKDKNNKPVKEFETVSTKKMHLVVVSKDFSYFAHIHPTFKGNGRFEITTTFPASGDYKLIAEMTPVGASDYSIENHWVKVQGTPPPSVSIEPDSTLTKVINGTKVTLSFDGKPTAQKNIDMNFTLYNAKTNKPITNLKPYLGTVGHAVAIDRSVAQFMHIHPLYPKGKGPKVTFMTYFPTKGVYKVWGQFNVNGQILTVPFVINVE
ncbi:hypothetical protein [Neobacillus cucumis]|uniref:hypothetical protein n=1 Tax=Neobacillus cucumis TaxID=1740721 RepID=UPI001963A542|nr:hypothetical protein [Neobacillus cucumis]MBM7651083.1 hypothetical protein [Neobacillus cucumis]